MFVMYQYISLIYLYSIGAEEERITFVLMIISKYMDVNFIYRISTMSSEHVVKSSEQLCQVIHISSGD